MGKLINLKFIVTVAGMACIEGALLAGRIEGPLFATMMAGMVAGYMAIEWQASKA